MNPLTRNNSEGGLQALSTIQNDEDANKGVLIYGLKELFGEIERCTQEQNDSSVDEESKEQGKNNASNSFIVKCSYFEIYNDTVYDLLSDINEFDQPLLV